MHHCMCVRRRTAPVASHATVAPVDHTQLVMLTSFFSGRTSQATTPSQLARTRRARECLAALVFKRQRRPGVGQEEEQGRLVRPIPESVCACLRPSPARGCSSRASRQRWAGPGGLPRSCLASSLPARLPGSEAASQSASQQPARQTCHQLATIQLVVAS